MVLIHATMMLAGIFEVDLDFFFWTDKNSSQNLLSLQL